MGSDLDTGPGLDETACDDSFPDALFCSGVELSTLSDWDAVTAQTSGTAAWSTDLVYRGEGAFRAQIESDDARAFAEAELSSAVSSGPLYMRAYLYISSTNPITSGVLSMRLLAPDSTEGMELYVRESSVLVRHISYFTGTRTGRTYIHDSPIPSDRWVCVELMVSLGDTGSYAVSLDGAEIVSSAIFDTRLETAISVVAVGLIIPGVQETGGDLSFDEIVVDDSPIGCD